MSNLTSHRSSLVFLAITLLTFLAASSAPTPLYHLYQEGLHFSAGMLTLIFGVYALSLLVALLTVGSLSDHLGRKPVIFTALLLEMLAMLLFIHEDSVAWLIAARTLQGFATGMATAVLGAALLDTDRQHGPLINSVAPLLGMACGAMGCSLLVEFAPFPTTLIYWTLLSQGQRKHAGAHGRGKPVGGELANHFPGTGQVTEGLVADGIRAGHDGNPLPRMRLRPW